MAIRAITIKYHERCGITRSKWLFGRIWSRACKRAYGKRRHQRPIGFGCVDYSQREQSHLHLYMNIEYSEAWFLECLQESCQHFSQRYTVWHKVLPQDERIGYIKYIQSKHFTNNELVW